MILRIFSSFCESIAAKHTIERVFPNYNNVKITGGNDYTHVLLFNTAMPEISHIPKERVVGLAFEPPFYLGLSAEFVEYAQKYIGKYYIGEIYDLPKPFIEGYTYMWHCNLLKEIPVKTGIMSIMVSNKQIAPGHKYRHGLVKLILNSNLPIDIYGNGCGIYSYTNDSRLKGEFTEHEPYESYDFHIAIENYETNHYFSEKVTNPLLCSAVPIYLGCRNIDSYFPKMVITMSGNISEDIALLHKIIYNPDKYKNPIDVSFVEKRTNVLLHLDEIFS